MEMAERQGDVPPPDPEIPAVMHDRTEELRDLMHRLETARDAHEAERLHLTLCRRLKATAVTLLRYALRAFQAAAAVGGGTLDAAVKLKILFPERFAEAVSFIQSLLPGLPKLF